MMRTRRFVILASLLALGACAGPVNDYTNLVNAAASEALDNIAKRRAEQNDLKLRAAALEYCFGVSIGAVVRRYATKEDLEAYLRACEIERRLGL